MTEVEFESMLENLRGYSRWAGKPTVLELAADELERMRAALAAPVVQPAPQPLSDEQIDAITVAQWGGEQLGVMLQAHRAYARAILAADGITPTAPTDPQEPTP